MPPGGFLGGIAEGSEQFRRVCDEYREKGNAVPPAEGSVPYNQFIPLKREYDAALELLRKRFPNHAETPIDEKTISGLWGEIVNELYLSKN